MLNFDMYVYLIWYNKRLLKKKIEFTMKNDILKSKYEILRLNIFETIYIYYVYTMLFLKINFQGYIQSLSSLNKKNVCF